MKSKSKEIQECEDILRRLLNMPIVKVSLNSPDIALAENAIQTLAERAEVADRAERAITNPNE